MEVSGVFDIDLYDDTRRNVANLIEGLNSSRDTSIFANLQREHAIWRQHNFPDAVPWYPLAGIMEEIGELAEAVLEKKSPEDEIDAICDCIIYLADMGNFYGINLKEVVDARIKSKDYIQTYTYFDPKANLKLTFLVYFMRSLGRIARSTLKLSQGIYANQGHLESRNQAVGDLILHSIDYMNQVHHVHLFDALEKTWLEVSKRDFIASPIDGGRDDITREVTK